jgi:hypothetical protein
MNTKNDPTSGNTVTADPEHEAKHPESHRGTTAGLGMFDRVNNLVGTQGIGVSSSFGGALETPTLLDSTPTIAGVDDTTHFSEEDDRYWRENHGNRAYANPASTYEDYQPAYRYGTDAAHRYRGKTWDQVEGDLAGGWDRARGTSPHPWEHAKEAVRAAWHRMEHPFSGDANRDRS